MEFWFHCNSCTRRPENWALVPNYHLTSCGHILCNECFGDIDTTKVCKFCQRTEITARAIDATLPPHIQKFFMPPKLLIESAEKLIKETITFQHSQKVLMERCLVRKIVQLWYQLQAAKQNSEVKYRLEMEIASLKNALKNLKGELLRTLNSHREFEKQALRWGFRALSVQESEQNFSREQETVQVEETRIFTENGDMSTNNASILANDNSLSSQISDEPLDLSMKRKVNPVSEESISTCSALNSDLAKCPTAPFNSLTSITLSKKDHTTGVQESRTQKNAVSSSKLRANGSGFTRRKHSRLQNSDHISHSRYEYSNWTASVEYPMLTLRRIRADTTTKEKAANDESM